MKLKGRLKRGDFIVFKNVGGYTLVFAPSFIKPIPAVYAMENNNEYKLVKNADNFNGVFNTYIF